MIARGTIVLTPFPFTDLSGNKVRPAVVVSRSDHAGGDLVLAFISSVPPAGPTLPTEVLVHATDADFQRTGLKVTSVIKLDKLATLNFGVLFGSLGILSARLLKEVDAGLKYALALS